MKKTRRSGQIGDVVRSELARIILRELSDPLFMFATITGVEMSPDMKHARVFVSSLRDEELAATVEALRKGAARIRFLLGQKASLRYTPELDFREDRTSIQASAIEKILHDVLPQQETSPDDDNED
ncbi:MAG: 30S ribosome-binding factor RbfA [Acidobacteriota bacterium]